MASIYRPSPDSADRVKALAGTVTKVRAERDAADKEIRSLQESITDARNHTKSLDSTIIKKESENFGLNKTINALIASDQRLEEDLRANCHRLMATIEDISAERVALLEKKQTLKEATTGHKIDLLIQETSKNCTRWKKEHVQAVAMNIPERNATLEGEAGRLEERDSRLIERTTELRQTVTALRHRLDRIAATPRLEGEIDNLRQENQQLKAQLAARAGPVDASQKAAAPKLTHDPTRKRRHVSHDEEASEASVQERESGILDLLKHASDELPTILNEVPLEWDPDNLQLGEVWRALGRALVMCCGLHRSESLVQNFNSLFTLDTWVCLDMAMRNEAVPRTIEEPAACPAHMGADDRCMLIKMVAEDKDGRGGGLPGIVLFKAEKYEPGMVQVKVEGP